MKATIIAIGTGASNITESAIFEHFGFDLCYYLINECTLTNEKETYIDSIVKKAKEYFQRIILFSTLGGSSSVHIPTVTATLAKYGLKYDAIVTLPFLWEGEKKQKIALNSIDNITQLCNSISTFPNNEMINYKGGMESVRDTFNWMNNQIIKLIEQILENKLVESTQSNIDFPFTRIYG